MWNQQPAKVGWHIIFRTPELQGQGSADESSGWTVILWIHKGRDEAAFKKTEVQSWREHPAKKIAK